jgi:multidrug efflux system membrane fusion protein
MDAPANNQSSIVGGVIRFFIFVLVCAGAGWGGWAYFLRGASEAPPAPPRPPAPVTVAPVVQKTISRQLQEIGAVEAYSTVNVKSQVEGQLTAVYFQEGQDIKKGDPLFLINPEPFQTQVDKAKADVAAKEAEYKAAQDTSEIKQTMFAKNAASKIEMITATDQVATTKAQVDMARAALEQAQINLGWTKIAAPITGRTGSLMVHQGNIVKANGDTALVVITQVAPIYVTFSVPEQYLSEIKGYMAQGKLKVLAAVPGSEDHPEEGLVTFLDNAVDTTTGTIRLKGTFDNTDRKLWPGQFVNVTLILASEPNAILVPSQAIQTGQKGQYVFVLKPDKTVEYRTIVSRRSYEGNCIIEQGLKAGETVITDGQLNLVDGSKVEIKTNTPS